MVSFACASISRILKNVTRKDEYTLPQLDELLDHLQGAKVLFSIDLAS